MRSVKSRWTCKANCYGFYRRNLTNGSGRIKAEPRMSGWSQLRIEIAVKELGCPRPRLTRAGTETLLNYDWPGNIRELCNVIQRSVIFAQGGALEFDLAMGNQPADPSFS